MTSTNPILKAYREWTDLAPFHRNVPAQELFSVRRNAFVEPAHFDGACCDTSHFTDAAVPCPREKAWQYYVRLRDGGRA